MIKYLQLQIEYDGTGQGDIDRDAFKTVCDAEVLKGSVIPSITGIYNNTVISEATISGNIISATIQYLSTNLGINDSITFWNTCQTELGKATVVAGSETSRHDCFIDIAIPCSNSEVVTK